MFNRPQDGAGGCCLILGRMRGGCRCNPWLRPSLPGLCGAWVPPCRSAQVACALSFHTRATASWLWLCGVDTVISVVQGQEPKVRGTQGHPAADTPVPLSPGSTLSGRPTQGNIRCLKLMFLKEKVLPVYGEETAEETCI